MITAINNENPILKMLEAEGLGEDVKVIKDFLADYERSIGEMPSHPSKEDLMIEAVNRMKELGFTEETIEAFKEHGEISYVMEGNHTLPLDEVDRKQIKRLSDDGFLVYAAIRSTSMFGRMTSYVLVSNFSEDWFSERPNIRRNILLAYVYNHDDPFCSEIGNIRVARLSEGMLERVW